MPTAVPAAKGPTNAFFPEATPAAQRPRAVGVTHVLDRLHNLIPAELAPLAPYIDVVKLGWGLPLLLPREAVRARIKLYHEMGLEVSTGGTLLEYAVTRDRVAAMMDEAKELGFDIVEISDGIIELSAQQIDKLAQEARRRRFDFYIEVGKKNPQ